MHKRVMYEDILELVEKSLDQYIATPDDMWHGSIIPSATFYLIDTEGYIALDDTTIVDYYHNDNKFITFETIAKNLGVQDAIVPSYNTQFYQFSQQLFMEKTVDTLLFKHQEQSSVTKELCFDVVTEEELLSVLDYSKNELNDEGEWLKGYFSTLIEKKGLMRFYDEGEVVGLGEIREYKGAINIGMSVSIKHRQKGYATKIVNQLVKLNSEHEQVTIIASTTASNHASIKTLKKCGFINYHNIYKMENIQK